MSASISHGEKIRNLDKRAIRSVFTDFDHTLSEHDGRLNSATVEALERLRERGLHICIVSGCSAGTGESLIRLLPVDAVIFENGAGIFSRSESDGRTVEAHWLVEPSDPSVHKRKLDETWAKVKSAVPEARRARGHSFRLFDCAVDYREQPPELSAEALDKVENVLRQDTSIQFKRSSIHINFWMGRHDKRSACEWWIKKNINLSVETSIYCGDSPNDETLFELFPHSIGVKNITPFLEAMSFKPRFLSDSPYGAGFREVVNHLLTP